MIEKIMFGFRRLRRPRGAMPLFIKPDVPYFLDDGWIDPLDTAMIDAQWGGGATPRSLDLERDMGKVDLYHGDSSQPIDNPSVNPDFSMPPVDSRIHDTTPPPIINPLPNIPPTDDMAIMRDIAKGIIANDAYVPPQMPPVDLPPQGMPPIDLPPQNVPPIDLPPQAPLSSVGLIDKLYAIQNPIDPVPNQPPLDPELALPLVRDFTMDLIRKDPLLLDLYKKK